MRRAVCSGGAWGVLCLVGCVVGVWAQGDSQWRAKNDHGSRYEGLQDVPNAGRDYEVLGLFGSHAVKGAPYVAGEGLKLEYYVPKADSVASVTVREVERDTYYRMEAKPDRLPKGSGQWNVYSDWPLSDVIAPKHVELPNLAVLVLLHDDVPGGLYSPALLYTDTAPHGITEYTVQFVSRRKVRGATCTAVTERGVSAPCELREGGAGAGVVKTLEESVPVEAVVSAKGLAPGRVTVRLDGMYANTANEKLAAEVHFVHQPLS